MIFPSYSALLIVGRRRRAELYLVYQKVVSEGTELTVLRDTYPDSPNLPRQRMLELLQVLAQVMERHL